MLFRSQKDILFSIGDLNANVGSQDISGVKGKFGLRVQNEARQRLTRGLPREYTGHSKENSSNHTTDNCTHSYHQIVNTKIRSNCQHPLDQKKARGFQKNIYFCFIDDAKALTMWSTTNCRKFLKR